ncbi:hypothetical protein CI109_105982 [Kwoniella shandongensis]|uniref:Uncharacterized protein n=1 Tax=Kwoniella shandongensis TaxID=1734106 RepID=A0A5M6BZ89_9TREE|nr:uncharacterized protein CI109_003970 [Kwoniella shandongensis]KAA5527711.1 hypothetical protein CI109_003970 [Kwoniella shandongensis]
MPPRTKIPLHGVEAANNAAEKVKSFLNKDKSSDGKKKTENWAKGIKLMYGLLNLDSRMTNANNGSIGWRVMQFDEIIQKIPLNVAFQYFRLVLEHLHTAVIQPNIKTYKGDVLYARESLETQDTGEGILVRAGQVVAVMVESFMALDTGHSSYAKELYTEPWIQLVISLLFDCLTGKFGDERVHASLCQLLCDIAKDKNNQTGKRIVLDTAILGPAKLGSMVYHARFTGAVLSLLRTICALMPDWSQANNAPRTTFLRSVFADQGWSNDILQAAFRAIGRVQGEIKENQLMACVNILAKDKNHIRAYGYQLVSLTIDGEDQLASDKSRRYLSQGKIMIYIDQVAWNVEHFNEEGAAAEITLPHRKITDVVAFSDAEAGSQLVEFRIVSPFGTGGLETVKLQVKSKEGDMDLPTRMTMALNPGQFAEQDASQGGRVRTDSDSAEDAINEGTEDKEAMQQAELVLQDMIRAQENGQAIAITDELHPSAGPAVRKRDVNGGDQDSAERTNSLTVAADSPQTSMLQSQATRAGRRANPKQSIQEGQTTTQSQVDKVPTTANHQKKITPSTQERLPTEYTDVPNSVTPQQPQSSSIGVTRPTRKVAAVAAVNISKQAAVEALSTSRVPSGDSSPQEEVEDMEDSPASQQLPSRPPSALSRSNKTFGKASKSQRPGESPQDIEGGKASDSELEDRPTPAPTHKTADTKVASLSKSNVRKPPSTFKQPAPKTGGKSTLASNISQGLVSGASRSQPPHPVLEQKKASGTDDTRSDGATVAKPRDDNRTSTSNKSQGIAISIDVAAENDAGLEPDPNDSFTALLPGSTRPGIKFTQGDSNGVSTGLQTQELESSDFMPTINLESELDVPASSTTSSPVVAPKKARHSMTTDPRVAKRSKGNQPNYSLEDKEEPSIQPPPKKSSRQSNQPRLSKSSMSHTTKALALEDTDMDISGDENERNDGADQNSLSSLSEAGQAIVDRTAEQIGSKTKSFTTKQVVTPKSSTPSLDNDQTTIQLNSVFKGKTAEREKEKEDKREKDSEREGQKLDLPGTNGTKRAPLVEKRKNLPSTEDDRPKKKARPSGRDTDVFGQEEAAQVKKAQKSNISSKKEAAKRAESARVEKQKEEKRRKSKTGEASGAQVRQDDTISEVQEILTGFHDFLMTRCEERIEAPNKYARMAKSQLGRKAYKLADKLHKESVDLIANVKEKNAGCEKKYNELKVAVDNALEDNKKYQNRAKEFVKNQKQLMELRLPEVLFA